MSRCHHIFSITTRSNRVFLQSAYLMVVVLPLRLIRLISLIDKFIIEYGMRILLHIFYWRQMDTFYNMSGFGMIFDDQALLLHILRISWRQVFLNTLVGWAIKNAGLWTWENCWWLLVVATEKFVAKTWFSVIWFIYKFLTCSRLSSFWCLICWQAHCLDNHFYFFNFQKYF